MATAVAAIQRRYKVARIFGLCILRYVSSGMAARACRRGRIAQSILVIHDIQEGWRRVGRRTQTGYSVGMTSVTSIPGRLRNVN